MATKLQQIQTQEKLAIPALSQSKYEDLGCECNYVAKHIEGLQISGPDALRGQEIHDILKRYVNHLVRTKQRKDVAEFDQLINGASDAAYDAIFNFAERYELDWDKVVGTELRIRLDANFKPIFDPKDSDAVAHEGTLDLVLLNGKKAVIPDYKSYWAIIDVDTFQSEYYPLLLMCLNPAIEEVEFVLEFVRYGVARSVTYHRSDMPKLIKRAEAARRRQIAIHENYFAGQNPKFATPGKHCVYCPKLNNGCPVVGTNPWNSMEPEERVAFAVWLKAAEKQNTEILKTLCAERGPIAYRDANDKAYEAGFARSDRKSYPLVAAGQILSEYRDANPGDTKFIGDLTVGGLSAPLKAKFRKPLADRLISISTVNTVTSFKVGKADEDEEE